ncbi:MAG: alcohol dehydrogenase catalytic domain-containing protein [bacterium]|nr:alcohol dehydrogenase catalytic domain-containing protein [Acidimicrobiia bacterium]MCY4648966.1 alcohol dehydrogenase catalytic domain-containing protein [bacterium]
MAVVSALIGGKGVALRAVQTVGPGRLQIVDTVSPRVGTESLVRLERAGICGTDLKIMDGSTPVDYPRVLGHELVGTVAVAESGGKIAAGARVLVNPGIHCGSCHLCRKDLAHLCGRGGLLGRDFDGVFAEEIALGGGNLHPVSEEVGPDDAGLLQVLGTVIHAQQTVDVSSQTVAVVIGLGVSGLLHVQVLRERGAGVVVGVTRSAWKLELASRLGTDVVATPDEARRAVEKVSGNRGADLVVEAVGTESTVLQAIELCAPGGHVIVYGTVTGTGGRMPYYQLYFKELTLHSPRAARPGDYDAAIRLAAQGRIRLAPLVTARYPLEQAEEAFAAARSGDHLKVLLTP